MTPKHIDLGFVILLSSSALVVLFSLGARMNYPESLLLVFGVPSLYLSLRYPRAVRKVAWFSFLVSIPMAAIVELVAYWDHAWMVPASAFGFRLFGFSPVENYLWQFLTVYLIVIFYERFCNTHFNPHISRRMYVLAGVLWLLMCAAITLFFTGSPLLHFSYPYLWFCVPFFVVPIILFLIKYPQYFFPFLKVQVFFFVVHTAYEIAGVKFGYWIYPSAHYLGWVPLFGVRFPVEEFLFVMVLGAFAACTYYELFTNDTLGQPA